ncbi:serpin family protein, partial [bacterium]|nr:serpin family protein [bacterium]
HWLSHFSNQSVDIYLPRFKLQYDLTLNDALTALGMDIAFSSEAADFSKMYQDVRIWIDRVKHKTFVEVNEEGTEAAAVTSVHMAGTTSGDPQDPLFQANRPFLFMIRENYSQTILFIGKIVDPTQGG